MSNKLGSQPRGKEEPGFAWKSDGFAEKVTLQSNLTGLMNHGELVIPESKESTYRETWRHRSVLLERTNNLNSLSLGCQVERKQKVKTNRRGQIMKSVLCHAEEVRLHPEDDGEPLAEFWYRRKTAMAKVWNKFRRKELDNRLLLESKQEMRQA